MIATSSEGRQQEQINLAAGPRRGDRAVRGRCQAEIEDSARSGRGDSLHRRRERQGHTSGGRRLSWASPGGINAVNLKVAEQYVAAFANLAKTNNTLIVPSNLSDLAGPVATADDGESPRPRRSRACRSMATHFFCHRRGVRPRRSIRAHDRLQWRQSRPRRHRRRGRESARGRAWRVGAVRQDHVADEGSARAAVAAGLAAFIALHGVINCAGVAIGEKILGKEGPHALASQYASSRSI